MAQAGLGQPRAPLVRTSGVSLHAPVAYHCVFKLGFQDPTTRVLAHSLFGCAVYGARQPASAASPGTRAIPVAADARAGAVVFRAAGCGSCHTLAAANSHGQVGPNLDNLRPGYEQVRAQVENGGGTMPA